MGYLRLYDYISNIQTPTLTQVIQGNDAARILKEAASQAKIISYLTQKFDCDSEFKNTTVFKPTATYSANSLVELNYLAWSNAVASYTANSLVSYTDGNVYICILPTTTAHELPTNATYWRLVGAQHDLNYVALPYPLFQMNNYYEVGDRVFWRDKIYECLSPTQPRDHFSDLNAFETSNIPLLNVFPDNRVNGKTFWGAGSPYSINGLVPNSAPPAAWVAGAYTAGQRVVHNGLQWKALTNNSVEPGADIINWQSETWTFGDNRNAEIVECMVWITIRKLSPLISPRNIPVLWENKYNECLTWLQMCAQGDVTLSAPEIQPASGSRIRSGGKVKQQNGY